VLAFGEVIRQLYLRRGGAQRAWTRHEAVDTRVLHPRPELAPRADLAWVGNWGDEERTAELRELLIEPVKALELSGTVHGVRYPKDALAELEDAGLAFGGWVPNFEVPTVFARHRVTVHVPRRPYVEALPGIPTIRPFEALACGIPLVSAPWDDAEGLFTAGRDYLVARTGAEMKQQLRQVLEEPALSRELVANGLRTVLGRHTCAHRVNALLDLHAELQAPAPALDAAGAMP
jgi:spore maturation protein CgeB